MQRPRYQLRNVDWITFALIFVIAYILSWIPYLDRLLAVAAISAVLYIFFKSLH